MLARKESVNGYRNLKRDVLAMGKLVEGMVKRAIEGLVEHDDGLARRVIEMDSRVDRSEVEIDNLCIDLFNSRKLDPHETRCVACGMKIVADLERMGDLAVDICQMVIELNRQPALKPYITLPKMTGIVEKMVEGSLRSYVEEDASHAYAVIHLQEEIERHSRDIFEELVEFMSRDIFSIYRSTRLLGVTRYLERLGAHAANISEMVVLMVKGEDVRHQRKGS